MNRIIYFFSLLVLLSCAEINESDNVKKLTIVTDSIAHKEGELTKEIMITGEVSNPLVITVDSLKSMNVFEGGEHQLVCRSGDNRKRINNFKGVLLKDILEKALVKLNHKESGRYIVKITSTNNYIVTYALNEILFNSTGDNIYVIFEENGLPITNDGGLMSVITLNDKITGVRHVKWPQLIEVIKL